jgi:glycosyltransferase involved in cell wall biosynthesis
MELPKVSCVMTTYGRMTCVERSVKMWTLQDYEGPLELVILNTDEEQPIVLSADWSSDGRHDIRVINNNVDLETNQFYTNVGAIRRDATQFATGEYYICWDDDDIFLPWNVRQCVDGILRHPNIDAWKPAYSLFEIQNNPDGIVQAMNTLEASFIVRLSALREIGFNMENGTEHLKWYIAMQASGRMMPDFYSIPGYSYRWNDHEIAGHKQSGHTGDKNNFENHKKASRDRFTRPLTLPSNDVILHPYYDYFRCNIGSNKVSHRPDLLYPPNFDQDLIDKYVIRYL